MPQKITLHRPVQHLHAFAKDHLIIPNEYQEISGQMQYFQVRANFYLLDLIYQPLQKELLLNRQTKKHWKN